MRDEISVEVTDGPRRSTIDADPSTVTVAARADNAMASSMTAVPIWFATSERPCFGWLHLPEDGLARGAVLLCPPGGYEYISSHRTLRTLAERLAARGLVALRFDYDGTGDSAGDDRDPGRVASWLGTVGHASDVLRSTGAVTVAAVGMRLGATLAATTMAQGLALDALVLWDPVWSGRTMMRQLRALHQVGVGLGEGPGDGDGSLEVAGVRYSAQTAEHLAALQFPDLSEVTVPTLILTRPHDPVRAPSDRLPAGATWTEAIGQEELLDRESSISLVPEGTLEAVATWLDERFPSSATPVAVPKQAATVRMPGGVDERTVRLGPLGLFGIVGEADTVPGRPTLVLLNNASDHHVGPSRMWVDWGRQMARLGFRVARVDLSGIGDSPVRPGQVEDLWYPPSRVRDLAEITAGLSDGNGVVVVGLCSGGRIAIDAGPDIDARGVVAINVVMNTPAAGLELLVRDRPAPRIVAAASKWHPVRHHVFIRLPKRLWRTLDRTGAVPSVCRPLFRLSDAGTRALIVWGADEYGLQRTREKSQWALDELARRPGCRIEILADVDHGLMHGPGREKVAALVTAHLMATFGTISVADLDRADQRH